MLWVKLKSASGISMLSLSSLRNNSSNSSNAWSVVSSDDFDNLLHLLSLITFVVSSPFTDSFLVEESELELRLLCWIEGTSALIDWELSMTWPLTARFSIEFSRKSIWVSNSHLGNVNASAPDLVFLSLLFRHLEKLPLIFFEHFFKSSTKK